MTIAITCPCGAKLKAPDHTAGKTGVCPKCKTRFTVPAAAITQTPISPQPLPVLAPHMAGRWMYTKKEEGGKLPSRLNSTIMAVGIAAVSLLTVGVTLALISRALELVIGKPAPSDEPAIAVHAPEFFTTYVVNEVAFDQRFRGKLLHIDGIVQQIRHDDRGRAYVELDTERGPQFMPSVIRCTLSSGSHPLLAKAGRFGFVKLVGRYRGKTNGDLSPGCWIELEDCQILMVYP